MTRQDMTCPMCLELLLTGLLYTFFLLNLHALLLSEMQPFFKNVKIIEFLKKYIE